MILLKCPRTQTNSRKSWIRFKRPSATTSATSRTSARKVSMLTSILNRILYNRLEPASNSSRDRTPSQLRWSCPLHQSLRAQWETVWWMRLRWLPKIFSTLQLETRRRHFVSNHRVFPCLFLLELPWKTTFRILFVIQTLYKKPCGHYSLFCFLSFLNLSFHCFVHIHFYFATSIQFFLFFCWYFHTILWYLTSDTYIETSYLRESYL